MPKFYFKNIHPIILNHLSESKCTLEIAVAYFNDEFLFDELLELLKRGVSIRVIITSEFTDSRLNWVKFQEMGGKVYIYGEKIRTMHHKFCIIDGETLISGSYNWTHRAEKNKENIVIFRSDDKLDLSPFQQEFQEIIDEIMLPKVLTPIKNISEKDQLVNYEEVKEFMFRTDYIKFKEMVVIKTFRDVYIVFINSKNSEKNIYFSKRAAILIKEGQQVTEDFLARFIMIEKNPLGEAQRIRISLREEIVVGLPNR